MREVRESMRRGRGSEVVGDQGQGRAMALGFALEVAALSSASAAHCEPNGTWYLWTHCSISTHCVAHGRHVDARVHAAHTRARTHTHEHTRTHTQTHTQTHAHTHAHTHTHTRTHAHAHSHTQSHTQSHPHTQTQTHTRAQRCQCASVQQIHQRGAGRPHAHRRHMSARTHIANRRASSSRDASIASISTLTCHGMLHVACCMPHVACCMLHVACRMLHAACLHAACCMLHAACAACCMPHVACRMPHVACRMLHVACRMLHASNSTLTCHSGSVPKARLRLLVSQCAASACVHVVVPAPVCMCACSQCA
jgi:hypothetical protein